MNEEALRLVRDVCHEVGNLLAAVRLEAHLLDESAGERISGLSGRAGALLSLLSPLLEAAPGSPGAFDPLDLLGGVQAELEDPRVRVALRSAVDLPRVRFEADVLTCLLVAEVGAALERVPDGGQVRVAAEAQDGGVAFVVESPPDAALNGAPAPSAGRGLTRAIAEALLPARGGAVTSRSDAAGARVVFRLPAA